MKRFKVVVITVLITLAIVIAFLNRENVKINLIFTSINPPQMLSILVTFAAGFLSGLITLSLLRRKSAKEKKK
jgi:uncharacterized integral membrane protein